MHQAAFCPRCAAGLVERVPADDDRVRKVCPRCAFVVYLNPVVAAGTVPVRDGKLALVRRRLPPGPGLWTFPCGYVEIDETVEQCAVRETREETGLTVGLGDSLGVLTYPVVPADGHTPTTGKIVMGWATTAAEGRLVAGDDADDARWFAPDELPWDALAFDSTRRIVREQLARLAGGQASA